MDTNSQRVIYQNALASFGYDKQMLMLVEECGELLSAIGKLNRGRISHEDVLDELADVSIMVEQIAEFFNWNFYLGRKEFKLLRLRNRIEDYREKAVQ